jgi:ribosome-binding factor A
MRDEGRGLRVADFIRDQLLLIITQQMRDPRVGLVSINDVKVSKDLAYADVYVTALDATDGPAQQALEKVLNGAAGYFRSELAKRHSMRTTPRLRFHWDAAAERAARIDALIERAVADDRRAHDGGGVDGHGAGTESGNRQDG